MIKEIMKSGVTANVTDRTVITCNADADMWQAEMIM